MKHAIAAILLFGAAGCRPAEPPMTAPPARHANRLILEKSPYLLQHAYNPVDWHPWGEEAIAKARREDKPIFLSIGYSTCHWCHVMERESFESPEIAALLNQWFVSIKVDREEHPDLDQVYMSAVTAMTGRGGWPLTVVLTPELQPFFGGTYFPPERRWQMPGMRELLPALAEAWRTRREELTGSAGRLTASLREQLSSSGEPAPVTVELLHAAFNQAVASFDPVAGGFGGAPKFPRSHELSFLLRYWARTRAAQALEIVTTTLDHLIRGGIHDHLGGGFHRYATDGRWLVPHFEKMLYDQALLARTFLEAYRVTAREDYAEAAREIFAYVLRDLSGPEGGFCSAEDADSEGREGAFYVWTPAEVLGALGTEDGELFNRFYGVTREGNFSAEGGSASGGEGSNVLHIERPLPEFAALNALEPAALAGRLSSCRARLLAARSARPRPHRDDKILTSWNGLMIAALAYGAATLEEPAYLEAARRAARFVLSSLRREGRLLRRYRDGDARYPATLEDHAFFLDGLLELYAADFDAAWLAEAAALAEQMLARFYDEPRGGFFLRGADEPPLLIRAKEPYDGATPSGNSMAVWTLLRLARLTGNRRFEAAARTTLEVFSGRLAQFPFAFPQMLTAADFALGPSREIVIAGASDAAETQQMLRAVRARFLPRAVAAWHQPGPTGRALEAVAPFVAAQQPLDGRPTAYICEQFVCRLPVTDAERFIEQLEKEVAMR
jgi:uncharacterized protein YyaL (SSP411 family)